MSNPWDEPLAPQCPRDATGPLTSTNDQGIIRGVKGFRRVLEIGRDLLVHSSLVRRRQLDLDTSWEVRGTNRGTEPVRADDCVERETTAIVQAQAARRRRLWS